MNEDLNLLEILKDAPKGTKLYCTIWGYVELIEVLSYSVICKDNSGIDWKFRNNGNLLASNTEYGECVLFPSKEQRDWSKFKLDLPIDTPVMVSATEEEWLLRFYAGDNATFIDGSKSNGDAGICYWSYIVPVKDFDFNDPKSNIDKSIC